MLAHFLTGTFDVYSGIDTRNTFLVSALKSGGWDIGDLQGSATDRSLLSNEIPSNPPVWLNDPDEHGLSLFLYKY